MKTESFDPGMKPGMKDCVRLGDIKDITPFMNENYEIETIITDVDCDLTEYYEDSFDSDCDCEECRYKSEMVEWDYDYCREKWEEINKTKWTLEVPDPDEFESIESIEDWITDSVVELIGDHFYMEGVGLNNYTIWVKKPLWMIREDKMEMLGI